MRNLGLDILRLIAVILVLGRHLHSLTPESNFLLKLWRRGGWVGVDLFFVLSGFLVSSIIFREHIKYGRADLKRFLIRRAFKIYPAFWIFIGVSFYYFHTHHKTPAFQTVLAELGFFQNYVRGMWGHTWSLAVEEHFYIGIAVLFAFMAWLTPKHNYSAIPLICAVISGTCLALRILSFYYHPTFDYQTHVFATHLRIDSLFYGVLISYLYNFRQLEERLASIPTWTFLAAGSLLISPAFIFPPSQYKLTPILGFILFYIGSGFLVIAALRLPDSRFRLLKYLGTIGAASYSIYLWHMPVNEWGWNWVKDYTGQNSLFLYLTFYLTGSLAFGLAMSRIVEIPFLRIRDFLFPSTIRATASH